jgi:dolichyl-phosphate-mannose--protein O-mannosyl transferase
LQPRTLWVKRDAGEATPAGWFLAYVIESPFCGGFFSFNHIRCRISCLQFHADTKRVETLYLVHYYPVMFLDRVVFDFSTLSALSVVGLIVSVVISIVLAYLCWILIERKFTGWLRRILLR